jgi:hypothetical protein
LYIPQPGRLCSPPSAAICSTWLLYQCTTHSRDPCLVRLPLPPQHSVHPLRARIGLPPVAVATVRRHPLNGCRAHPVDHFFPSRNGPSNDGCNGRFNGSYKSTFKLTLSIIIWSTETSILDGIHFPARLTFLLAPNRRYIACVRFSATPDHDCRCATSRFGSVSLAGSTKTSGLAYRS